MGQINRFGCENQYFRSSDSYSERKWVFARGYSYSRLSLWSHMGTSSKGKHALPHLLDKAKGSQKTKRVDVERNQTYYPESNVRAAAKVLTSVLASLFPGIVILALYLIDTTLKRIGAMLCFTTFFAFVLSYWTSAKTIEVFAATAGWVLHSPFQTCRLCEIDLSL